MIATPPMLAANTAANPIAQTETRRTRRSYPTRARPARQTRPTDQVYASLTARIVLFLCLVGGLLSFTDPSMADHDPSSWTANIGDISHLDFSGAQTVAIGTDKSIVVAGHTTTSFSADTATTWFEVFVQK